MNSCLVAWVVRTDEGASEEERAVILPGPIEPSLFQVWKVV